MGKNQGAPKEEIQNINLGESGILFKRRSVTNNLTAQSLLRSESSSPNLPALIQYPHHQATMQSIELYNPNSSNLNLASIASTYSLSEDFNPFNYQLTTDDFFALIQVDGQLLYTLDPSTTTALFWALQRLARYIVRAASHDLHSDPSIPFASRGYIPQSFFDRINMQRPDILTIQDHHFPNPLYGYTTRENLTAWYRDFQMVGRLAIQWIQTAKRQTLQLGPGTGWDWEIRHGSRLEFPNRRLLTDSSSNISSPTDSSSEATSEGTDEDVDSQSDTGSLAGHLEGDEKHVVLHPTESAYSIRYPDFDAFAGQTLVDNGYINNYNNQCQAMILHPTTTFDENLAHFNYYEALYMVPSSEENI